MKDKRLSVRRLQRCAIFRVFRRKGFVFQNTRKIEACLFVFFVEYKWCGFAVE
ncbi:hypothetical protein HMPREF1870_02421 [Bacteroidales bacterium KA00344]|nr:hypothetical protein HMPREF1870_02421 [Bacteroidales bacterium KA00344]